MQAGAQIANPPSLHHIADAAGLRSRGMGAASPASPGCKNWGWCGGLWQLVQWSIAFTLAKD